MHYARIVALVGVVIGVIGLFMDALTTEGRAVLETLNAANPAVPASIPSIWDGLDTWAQVVLAILIVIVVVLAVRPVIKQVMDRISALSVSVIGFVLLVYAIVKWVETSDKADALAGVFAQAFQAGSPLVPAAWAVDRGVGFFVLFLGAAVVALGGILSLISRSNAEEATD